jgi:hypothetical protein
MDAAGRDRAMPEGGREGVAMTRRHLVLGLGVFFAALAASAVAGGVYAEGFQGLAFGWVGYLWRVLPRVRVNSDGLATGVVCLVLFTVGLHGLLRWLSAEIGRASGVSPRRWSWRRTLAIVTLVMLMFTVGVAATGIAHQAGWLIAARRKLVETRTVLDGYDSNRPSDQRLHEIAFTASMFCVRSSLVIDSHFDKPSPARSWQTRLLPYFESHGNLLGGELDDTRPWNDPANSAYFRGVVPVFLNPEVGVVRSPEGYALSHYAGNVHVLGRYPPLNEDELTAGKSNTILAGEMATKFKPWGDPSNLVDPGLGINQSPEGFGGPSGQRAFLGFADGSVRSFSAKTDPEILRRLSGPRSGP